MASPGVNCAAEEASPDEGGLIPASTGKLLPIINRKNAFMESGMAILPYRGICAIRRMTALEHFQRCSMRPNLASGGIKSPRRLLHGKDVDPHPEFLVFDTVGKLLEQIGVKDAPRMPVVKK